jgi:hypothetical protein
LGSLFLFVIIADIVYNKQNKIPAVIFSMTKPVNPIDKPSATDKPVDNGGKSKIKKSDKEYDADQPGQENIAKKHEEDEQPVQPVKEAPKA